MKFSARSQYALEAMLALADSPDSRPIQVRAISREHGIPVRFLEQIMASLKKAGLVRSVRGARGFRFIRACVLKLSAPISRCPYISLLSF